MAFTIPQRALTAQQDIVFQAAVARANAERAAQQPPLAALTDLQYWNQVVLASLLDNFNRHWREDQKAAAAAAWEAQNP